MSNSSSRTQLLAQVGYFSFGPWADPERTKVLGIALGAHPPVLPNPHLAIPEVAELVGTPEITRIVSACIGDELWVENTFLITKPPGEMTIPPHQDGINSRLVLNPQRSLTVWLAITPATQQTGCLHVSPGSHHGGYRPTEVANLPGKPLTIAGPIPDDWVAVPADAGNGLVMDSRLIHHSPQNRTSTSRVGLNIRYVAPGGITMRDGSQPTHLTPLS
ncbi:phytanoyl-CoA dioxygenase family protein [Streptomyces sp. NPDC100445]|uniref:phytanoyl-CoA dioxygenase family protein n=1 Tax=Streptomyces sp. NPDC100445 TaxID=3366102 RepID=UPI0038017EE6